MSTPYPHVAVAIDHSEASLAALRLAGRLAADGAHLSVLHVVAPIPKYHAIAGQVIPVSPGARHAAELWLTGLASELPGADAVLIEGTHAGDEIVRWSEENHPDLIVLAPHEGLLSRALAGSIVSFVLQHAPVPVLVVRQSHHRKSRSG